MNCTTRAHYVFGVSMHGLHQDGRITVQHWTHACGPDGPISWMHCCVSQSLWRVASTHQPSTRKQDASSSGFQATHSPFCMIYTHDLLHCMVSCTPFSYVEHAQHPRHHAFTALAEPWDLTATLHFDASPPPLTCSVMMSARVNGSSVSSSRQFLGLTLSSLIA